MPMLCKKKKGFSLIESAIVLAVVGLVIGGIWVAAASVIETRKANQTVNAFLGIINKVGYFYPPNVVVTGSFVVQSSDWPIFIRGLDGISLYGSYPYDRFDNSFMLLITSTDARLFYLIGAASTANQSICVKITNAILSLAKGNSKIKFVRILKTIGPAVDVTPPFTQIPTTECSGELAGLTVFFDR